jgi:hypothetical protein
MKLYSIATLAFISLLAACTLGSDLDDSTRAGEAAADDLTGATQTTIKAKVVALYDAIGLGAPDQVMPRLNKLLATDARWVVPGTNGLTVANTSYRPQPFSPVLVKGKDKDDWVPRVTFEGGNIREYVKRLYDLSGQGAAGVAGAKFRPFIRSAKDLSNGEQPIVAKSIGNGEVEVLVQAEATAIRGNVALDGRPEKNAGPNHSEPSTQDGRIHGHGFYVLKVTFNKAGKIRQLETIPHDYQLFDGFWGVKAP